MSTPTVFEKSRTIKTVGLNTEEVRRVAEAEGVVRVNAPGLTAHGFADFLNTLGTPMFTEGETPVIGLPDLNVVTNVGRTSKPRSVYHSDTTYVARPPSYAGLLAVEVPERGGATMFLDQYEAYERLPEDLKSLLNGATMLHSATGVTLGPEAETSARHPVLRRHPGTGRSSLFLTTPARCSNLQLASGEDRSDLIAPLYDHALNSKSIRSHSWSNGDVIVWDNRCTLHAADHSDVQGNRTLFRGLIRGEVPTAADT
ncbi:MAG: TauD/TfdA family dioxygenase [Pseudomonadota bacterium]